MTLLTLTTSVALKLLTRSPPSIVGRRKGADWTFRVHDWHRPHRRRRADMEFPTSCCLPGATRIAKGSLAISAISPDLYRQWSFRSSLKSVADWAVAESRLWARTVGALLSIAWRRCCVSGVLPPSCGGRQSSEDANLLMASVRIYGRPYSWRYCWRFCVSRATSGKEAARYEHRWPVVDTNCPQSRQVARELEGRWQLHYPVPTANSKRLTATANRLILAPDERSLQVDLVRLDRTVPAAGCVASREPCPSTSTQRAAAQIPTAVGVR